MSSSVQSGYLFVVDTSILIDFVIRLTHIVLLSKTLPLRIFPFLYKKVLVRLILLYILDILDYF